MAITLTAPWICMFSLSTCFHAFFHPSRRQLVGNIFITESEDPEWSADSVSHYQINLSKLIFCWLLLFRCRNKTRKTFPSEDLWRLNGIHLKIHILISIRVSATVKKDCVSAAESDAISTLRSLWLSGVVPSLRLPCILWHPRSIRKILARVRPAYWAIWNASERGYLWTQGLNPSGQHTWVTWPGLPGTVLV